VLWEGVRGRDGASDETMNKESAKFAIGQIVQHRFFPFRGVIFDVDPEFANTEEWYAAIPEDIRPRRDQPFYHLLAENDQGPYIAYVSEQNLVPDETHDPVAHPSVDDIFEGIEDGQYVLKNHRRH
jgi:heat shock protein HspQ